MGPEEIVKQERQKFFSVRRRPPATRRAKAHTIGRERLIVASPPSYRVSTMALRIYNTKSRRKEPFPFDLGREVRMYVCGPTVYDHSHLGHARSYVAFDVVRRYLEFLGMKVHHVQNFTDV